jgi:hypothetical protein
VNNRWHGFGCALLELRNFEDRLFCSGPPQSLTKWLHPPLADEIVAPLSTKKRADE